MKCINHPETEAVGVCTNCNMPVCSACRTKIEKKTCCQSCYQIFLPQERLRSVKLTIAGILGIFAGAIAFFMAITSWAIFYDSFEDFFWFLRIHGYFFVLLMIPGLIAILGSRYALDKEHFWVAVTGGIFASLSIPPLGIPALVLIAKSKAEFRS